MKNRIVAALLCVSMTGLMLMGCADTRDDGAVKMHHDPESIQRLLGRRHGKA